MTEVDLDAALAYVDGVELVAATDVDSPLTGLFGATKTFGPAEGHLPSSSWRGSTASWSSTPPRPTAGSHSNPARGPPAGWGSG